VLSNILSYRIKPLGRANQTFPLFNLKKVTHHFFGFQTTDKRKHGENNMTVKPFCFRTLWRFLLQYSFFVSSVGRFYWRFNVFVFHTYHKTKEMLIVKILTSHKSLMITQCYSEIYCQTYASEENQFVTKIAATKEERVTLMNDDWYCRKPK